MKKSVFYIITAIIIGFVPVLFYSIIQTMLSIQNETDAIETCISKITGENLCSKIDQLKVWIYIDLIVLVTWFVLYEFILKKSNKTSH